MKRNELICMALILAVSIVLFPGCVTNQEGFVNGTTLINGSALSQDLNRYVIEVGESYSPKSWTTIGVGLTGDGNAAVNESILAMWNTSMVADGKYTLRLTVFDSNGMSSQDEVYMTVDNQPGTPTKQCPVWSCSGLTEGRNNVSIRLPQDSYGNNMNCSITCSCPAGMTMGAYSRGDTEMFYDYLYLGNNPNNALTGLWDGFYALMNTTSTISFVSDRTYDGSDGYGGFNVTALMCTPYCFSTSEDSSMEYISRVGLNTGDKSSGETTYSDYTSDTFTTLVPGQQYTMTVAVSTDYSETEYAKAWIDYNHDYDFNDPGEEIDFGAYQFSGTHVFSRSFTVPAGAARGKTRMRVTNRWYDPPAPCGLITYGEVEDYTIEIKDPGSTSTTTVTVTTTIPGACPDAGDYPPCGNVTITEILNAITSWSQNQLTIPQLLQLIGLWASG